MEKSLKLLTLASGIFITCVIISFSLLILREGKDLGNRFLHQMREEEKEYNEYRWTKYEGNMVTGAEVINAIKKYQEEIEIKVNNLTQETIYDRNHKFKIADNDSYSSNYIEPFDDYEGNIVRNSNGEIYKLIFKRVR